MLADTVEAGCRRATTASPDDVNLIVRSPSDFVAVGNSLPERATLPPSLVPSVQAVPGVHSAWGLVWGYAQLVDKEGKAIGAGSLPSIGTSWNPNQTLAEGRLPTGAGEVVIDEVTARGHGFSLGDRIKVLFQGAVESSRSGASGWPATSSRQHWPPSTSRRHSGCSDVPIRWTPSPCGRFRACRWRRFALG